MMTRKMPTYYLFSPALENTAGAPRSLQKDCFFHSSSASSDAMSIKYRNTKKIGGKSSYRHIPHSQKPPHLVAKRNARERRRVEAVNNAFHKLRKHVNFDSKQKRLSKVKTLRVAIDYIHRLQKMIVDHDRKIEEQRFERNREMRNVFLRGNLLLESNNTGMFADNICRRPSFWKNLPAKGNSRSDHPTPERSSSTLPEYGSLGMNEITGLPDM